MKNPSTNETRKARSISGLLALLGLWVLSASVVPAAPIVSLAWDPSPDADVVNYRLYWGPSNGVYTASRDLGNVTNTVFTSLVGGQHVFFVVTAFNAAGAESDPSNELDYRVPVTPPRQLRIVQTLQTASSPAGPWTELGTLSSLVEARNGQQFFRVMMAPPAVVP